MATWQVHHWSFQKIVAKATLQLILSLSKVCLRADLDGIKLLHTSNISKSYIYLNFLAMIWDRSVNLYIISTRGKWSCKRMETGSAAVESSPWWSCLLGRLGGKEETASFVSGCWWCIEWIWLNRCCTWPEPPRDPDSRTQEISSAGLGSAIVLRRESCLLESKSKGW